MTTPLGTASDKTLLASAVGSAPGLGVLKTLGTGAAMFGATAFAAGNYIAGGIAAAVAVACFIAYEKL
ncbi:MAG: hypothetical protein ACYDCK_01525 [Thermoplasmatota archaeon]